MRNNASTRHAKNRFVQSFGSSSVPGFVLSFLTLPASTLLLTMTLLVVMDWLIGPLRRDGLSSPGSPQLRRFLCRLLATRSPAGFWCRQARLIVPLDFCSSPCALGVLRGCFHCAELHACVGRHFGTRPPCHIRRFQLHWPHVVKPRLACTSDAPPLRAGSSCTCSFVVCSLVFPVSLCFARLVTLFQGALGLPITDCVATNPLKGL